MGDLGDGVGEVGMGCHILLCSLSSCFSVNVSGHEGHVNEKVCAAPMCAQTLSLFWNSWLHVLQGVVVGGSGGLDAEDCVDIDEQEGGDTVDTVIVVIVNSGEDTVGVS